MFFPNLPSLSFLSFFYPFTSLSSEFSSFRFSLLLPSLSHSFSSDTILLELLNPCPSPPSPNLFSSSSTGSAAKVPVLSVPAFSGCNAMAPPPVERTGVETTAADAARSLPTPFLTKTYQLVDDKAIDDIISWNEDGSTFIVWNPTEFAKDLLPKYFKHNNFSSFVRQLNTYGFRKVVPDRWEFSNDCFRRGEKRLLCDIQRRKIATPTTPTAAAPIAAAPLVTLAAIPSPPLRMVSPADSGEEQVISSNSSREAAPVLCRETVSGSNEELVDENDRLRRENVQLNKELSQMKSLCGNIYAMMSNYATSPPESCSPAAASNTGNNQAGSSTTAVVKPLDLLPLKRICDDIVMNNRTAETEEDLSPRLFGVPLGLKRSREYEGVTTEQYQELLQLQQPGVDVKSETLDRQSSGDDQGSSWYRRPDGKRCSSRD